MSPALTSAVRRIGPFVLCGLGVIVLILASAVFSGSRGSGYDFRAYDEAARRIAQGTPLYLADTVTRYNAGLYADLYIYPPQLAMALVPLTVFDQSAATVAWFVLRLVALGLGCLAMPVRPWIRFAVLGIAGLSFPVLYDLNLGNISLVVFALSALVWRLGERPAAGVVGAILVAIRLPFGSLGLAWLAMRRWRLVAIAIGTGIVLLVAAVPIVGFHGYADYLTILRGLRGISTGPDNLSLTQSFRDAGLPDSLATLSTPLGMIISAVFTVYVAARRDPSTATVVALTTPLLLAPFFHPHYLVALLIPAAFLADRGRPWALVLPLLGWLPGAFLPFVAVVGIVAPLFARPATDDADAGAQTATDSLSRTARAPSS
ncbi:MAG TPA: glycosyltransferase family 87 protein [Candidatus Acidoferrum sp.]|nr:glycosyltransferase family 87 protein [Candidatus Acidoferrum sp.]